LSLHILEIIGFILTRFHDGLVTFVDKWLDVFADLVVSVTGFLVHVFAFGQEHPIKDLTADYILEKRDF
jgi:tetrahydromethanopterin S-methyltransferase subunit E